MSFLKQFNTTLLVIIIALTQQLQSYRQTVSRAAQLTNLIAEGKAPAVTELKIMSLHGETDDLLNTVLPHFRNLTHLTISSLPNLTSLDLSQLTNLTNLELYELTRLQLLDLRKLTNLTNLKIDNTQHLDSLDLSHSTQLTNLQFVRIHSLQSLELTNLTQLTNLKLETLQLESLNLKGLNKLIELEITCVPTLQSLNLCTSTNLTKLKLTWLENLSTTSCELPYSLLTNNIQVKYCPMLDNLIPTFAARKKMLMDFAKIAYRSNVPSDLMNLVAASLPFND